MRLAYWMLSSLAFSLWACSGTPRDEVPADGAAAPTGSGGTPGGSEAGTARGGATGAGGSAHDTSGSTSDASGPEYDAGTTYDTRRADGAAGDSGTTGGDARGGAWGRGGAGAGGNGTDAGISTKGGAAGAGGRFVYWPYSGGTKSVDGGSAGTTAVIPSPPIPRAKVDLLFMIDNSSSMVDKQDLLVDALPALIERLPNPNCVDYGTGQVLGQPSGGHCAQGELEFSPIANMHIGLVSSSLGSHGVEGLCQDVVGDPESHNDDKGELVTRGATGSVVDGFLDWTAGDATTTSNFQNMVKGAGQHGCGYEAQLESVFRFLVDPNPPDLVTLDQYGSRAILQEGTDQTILTQRAKFLRPDSLVVVVLLSDENDCSLQEYGQAWLALAPGDQTQHTPLRPGTNPCNTNPNDPCCYNCALTTPPSGCPRPETYSNCVRNGTQVSFTTAEDPSNLRCWNQKQRYGIDFLYPVERYINGFREPFLVDQSGTTVANPLFDDLQCPVGATGCTRAARRDAGSFLFTAIVGVPWQDLMNDPANPATGYKSPANQGYPWSVVLGDPHASPPVPPTDPLMVASVQPRIAQSTGNPIGAAALPVTNFSAGPTQNPVNGHEWDTSKSFPQANADLQYACVFELPSPRDCSDMSTDCDCTDFASHGGPGPADYKSPLCQDDSGGFGTTQYRAKAYPGLRELEVVKGLGSQGLAVSICPASLSGNKQDASYGYNPAVQTMISMMRPHLPTP